MESVWASSLPIIQALQSVDWLEWPMRSLSWLGSEAFFLLFISLLYWCISPRLGLRIALILLFSTSLNSVLKLIFASPRPQWYSNQVMVYETESSFGMPSAHAQNAVAVWGELALQRQLRWLSYLATSLMVLIGLSRVYLGVHFPTDVLAGWSVGFIVLWLFHRFASSMIQVLQHCGLRKTFLIALATSLLLLLPSLLVVEMRTSGQLPDAGLQMLPLARAETMPQPLSLDIAISTAGTWLGFVFGALWLQARQPFCPKGRLQRRVSQYLMGISIAIAIWAGLDRLFPDGTTLMAYSLRYLRYALLGGWIAAGAPMIFQIQDGN
jgi:membrane-associated phospholipid phosphatase